MPHPHLVAVILAGGSGTRFWPASRASRPKQFLPIAGGRPMICETRERLRGLVDDGDVLLVTAVDQVDLVRAALPDLPEENILAEPEARNTAAAVALAALAVARRDPEAVQVVLPADHVIEPAGEFRRTLFAAAAVAAGEPCLVTLGIRPDHASTGYGYIEIGRTLDERDGFALLEVARFVEKPDPDTAQRFLESGRFLWNAGIFVWSTSAILAALARHAPAVFGPLSTARDGGLPAAYARVPRVPIDVAVLERAENVRCIPFEHTWSDVGSWQALHELTPADECGNRAVLADGARLVAEGARGCLAYAEGRRVVALVGVADLIVVQAGDATLVCPIERAQDVRKIVERLRSEGPAFL